MPFSPGNAFFEYRITRTLGQGAFGTVYLARDTLLERPGVKELSAIRIRAQQGAKKHTAPETHQR